MTQDYKELLRENKEYFNQICELKRKLTIAENLINKIPLMELEKYSPLEI